MAECLYDYATDVEIPSRLSVSSKKYFCHFCGRNCAVVEVDLSCKTCGSQFVEEITQETNLDEFRRRSTPMPDSDLFPGALAGLMDFHNRFTGDSSDEVVEVPGHTGHHLESLEPPSMRNVRANRPNRSDPSSSEVDDFRETVGPWRSMEAQNADEYPSDGAGVEEDEDSDNSEIDLETVSPLMQETLGNIIRRTIRRTMVDFGVPEDDTSNVLRLSLEAAAGRLSVGESGAERDSNVLSAIAEVSNNTHPRILHELFQLASNLDDYAFSGEWDAIVTQILNETDSSGSPPLDSKKIEAIPKIIVQKEDIYKSLQCTICLDDFRPAETAKNLPCNHVFHDDCIVPWLQLHDTCPICRKQINIE